MKTFSISGASDDLVETNGITGCDEFSIIKDGPWMTCLTIQAEGRTLDVHVIYNGYWAFAVGSSDGDSDEQPDWPIRRSWGRYALQRGQWSGSGVGRPQLNPLNRERPLPSQARRQVGSLRQNVGAEIPPS